LAEACSGASLLLSAVALMTVDTTSSNHTTSQRHCKTVLIISTLCAVLTAILWSYLLRTAAHFQEESLLHAARFMWLPFGPMLYMLLVFYLLHSLNGTARDVAKLQTSMYNLHTA
jgi:cytochrome bd-type quinol oxidase subunit 2